MSIKNKPHMFSPQPSRHTFSLILTKTASFCLAVFVLLCLTSSQTAIALIENEYNPSYYSSEYSVSSVSHESGSMVYSYDIAVPEGRNGMTPQVSLFYNSSNKKVISEFGVGWQVSIPYIERENKRGLDSIFENEEFASSEEGELVKVSTGLFAPKTETGNFKTYEFSNDVWSVKDKAGTIYRYGSTTGARVYDISSSSRTYRWLLESVEDANGNSISYSYYRDGNRLYPDTITYNQEGIYEIIFNRASSTNDYIAYDFGFEIDNTDRIDSIDVYFDSTLIKRYTISYDQNFLESITETGYGETAVSLAPVIFSYSSSSSDGTWSSDWDLPTYTYTDIYGATSTRAMYKELSMFFDANGDGLVDIYKIPENTSYYTPGVPGRFGAGIWLNQGDGTWSLEWNLPTYIFTDTGGATSTRYLDPKFSRFLDLNGDGLVDIYTNSDTISYYSAGFEGAGIWLNQGDGTWSREWDLPTFVHNSQDYHLNLEDSTFFDANGDGLLDIYKQPYATAVYTPGYFGAGVWLNQGDGTWLRDWDLPIYDHDGDDYYLDMAYSAFFDANGDGLADIYTVPQNTSVYTAGLDGAGIWINQGDGTWSRDWDLPTFQHNGDPYFMNFEDSAFIDINADGLIDVYKGVYGTTQYTSNSYGAGIWINQGDGTWSRTGDLPTYTFTHPDNSTSTKYLDPEHSAFFDANGDGLLDIYKESEVNEAYNPGHYGAGLWLNLGSRFAHIEEMTNEYGGVVSYNYTTAVNQNNSNSTPFIVTVLESEIKNDLQGNISTTTYTYGDADYFFDNAFNRRFAGFGSVAESTLLNNKVTYFHQGNGNNSTTSESGDSEYRIGISYRTDITDLSDNAYSILRKNYEDDAVTASSTFVQLSSQLTLDYDGDGDHKDSAVAYTYDPDHGSVLSATEYGEVSGNINGTFTDSGTDKRTTLYEYATNTDGVVVPKLEQLLNNSSTTVRESKFTYDNQSYGTVTNGNLTKREDLVDGTTYVDTQWTYNSYGLVTSETDPRNYTTTYSYDPYNLFVASTSNPLGHVTLMEYDYSSGKVSTTTDANGNVFVTTFDGLDRPLTEQIPDPQSGTLVTKHSYVYYDTPGEISVLKTNHLNGTTEQDIYTYFDGFARMIQQRVKAEDSNQYVVNDYVYGSAGMLEKESLPYFSTGTTTTTATNDSDLYTEYGYDALGRVVISTTTVGTTETVYDQWEEVVTDTLGNGKTFTYDAFERLTSVDEENDTSTYTTSYDWDANDNLTKVTDALGNIRNITYDKLSRRLTLEDLHDPADSYFGTWYFDYDAASNVSSTTDPNGQVVNYSYDELNRVEAEDYLGQSGTEITYSYDSCTEGVGLRCLAANGSATTTNTYTYNGLIATASKEINGTSYTTEYEYDRLDNKTLITYPDDSEARYTYNTANQIESIEQRENGGSFSDIVSNFDYGPHGLMTYALYGNAASTTKVYDEDEMYRLRSIITTATSTYGVGGAGAEFGEIEFGTELLFADLEQESNNSLGAEELTLPELENTTSTVATTAVEFSAVQEMSEEELATTTDIIAETEKTLKIPEVAGQEIVVSNNPADSPYNENASQYVISSNISNDDKITVALDKAKPKVKFQKWSGEVDFEIEYQAVIAEAIKENGSDKVKWKDGMEEVHAYPLAESALLPDGGFEIEVQLSEKPKSNDFEFQIDGYENLDFFYQPPLDEIDAEEGVTCSATECVDEEGEVVSSRPENVVGSYAVYHKEKQNQLEDQTNYGTGKAFHVYRPKAVDAEGNEVWGELAVEDGTLTVTIPQSFLAQATYPVLVDPTFGYTSAGGSSQSLDIDDYYGSLFTTPSDFGSFNSLSIYCGSGGAGGYDLKAVAVSHSSLNIVANGISNAVVCGSSSGWKTPSFSTNPSLSASTEYLLGGIASTRGRIDLYYDTGTSNQGHFDSSNDYSSPANLGSVSHNTKKYSTYITYTASGGGNATPTAPTLLETEGSTNPTNITDSAPEFTAIYNDPDSGDSAVNYKIQVDDNSDFSSTYWDSGKTMLATTTAGNRTGNISYGGSGLASSTTYYWRIKFWDDDDAEGDWSTTTAMFSLAAGGGGPTNATPTAPTLLETEGQTNPTDIADNTPEFTAIYTDPDSGDIATHYLVQVATTSGFESVYWDSGSTTLATSTTAGNRSEEITYSGTALASSTQYYWRIKFWDDEGLEGDWSTSTATFSLAESTSTPTFPQFSGLIQHLSYTYDAVGNITQIVDTSETNSRATTTYTYDDLYRLKSASTTQASTTPYSHTYTYNAIGNISTKSDQTGSYGYAGNTGTSYANPHAVTTINGLTYAYDNNGNLTSVSSGEVSVWNYRNEMTSSYSGSATTTYAYDHTGARVSKTVFASSTGGGSVSSSTSFRSPAATGDDYNEWSSYSTPSDAYASNNTYVKGASHYSTDEQDYYNFSFNIPSGATIDGIELQVEFKAYYNRTDELEAGLSWNGGSSITSLKSNSWSNEEETYKSYGGSTDTWGRSWSDSEFSNANFRVYLHQPSNWYGDGVDHLQVNVYYTTTGGGGSATSTTTVYPNSLYEVNGATSTKHIYAGDMLVATIEDDTPAPSTYYNHLDHLNSTNVVTDDIGYITQELAYYPFGGNRFDDQYGEINQTNRFTSHDYDAETDLTYMGARYYDGDVARFNSQDPVTLALGDWNKVSGMTRIGTEEFLMQPQKHNSYSYAGNNPLRYVDPHGESYWELNAGIAANPYAGNFGLKIDFENARMDFTYGAGPAAGASADLSLLYNSDDLPEAHSYITEEVEGVAGYGLIGRGTHGAQVGSPKPGDIEFNGGMSYGIGAGGGLSAAVTANHSFTLVDFSRDYNILKAALTKFAENLKSYSDFQNETKRKNEDEDNS